MSNYCSDGTRAKRYSAPKMVRKGAIEELTQQTKSFGVGDGIILIIPNIDVQIPLINYS